MNKKIIRPVIQNEIERFDHDGVILLKNMFDSDWISSLSQGLDKNIDLPQIALESGIEMKMAEPCFMTLKRGKTLVNTKILFLIRQQPLSLENS